MKRAGFQKLKKSGEKALVDFLAHVSASEKAWKVGKGAGKTETTFGSLPLSS